MNDNMEYLINNIHSAKFNFNKKIDIMSFCNEIIETFPKYNNNSNNNNRFISVLKEWFYFIKYLQYTIRLNGIQSPINIIKREHPDFELHSNISIGVEHTFGQTEKDGYANQLFSQAGTEAFLDVNSYLFNDEKPTREDTKKLIDDPNEVTDNNPDNDLKDDQCYGDQDQLLWAKVILNTILKKTIKLNKKHFNKFDKNLLIITEKMGLASDKKGKLTILRKLYNKDRRLKENNYYFDEIYIISKRWIEKV